MTDKWKVIAIVFISLFIVETLSFILLLSVGISGLKEERRCDSLCSLKEADSFMYDPSSQICSCYKNGEISFKEIIT